MFLLNFVYKLESSCSFKPEIMWVTKDLTMSRCSGFALFSSSSLTTSMWPSLAAEISAVQQSCVHEQTVTPGSALRSQTSGETPVQFLKTASTYQLIVPGAHGNTVPHGYVEHAVSESVKNRQAVKYRLLFLSPCATNECWVCHV